MVENMLNIEILEKPILGSPHMSYKAFKEIPTELLITEETPVGATVYAAEFPKSIKLILRKYHKPQSQHFPSGGYTLWNPKTQVVYSCYLDGAMVHPDNKKHKRKKQLSRKVSSFFE
jgi:hypothetical protein